MESEEIRNWDLAAHHLHYFIADSDDFDHRPMLKAVRKWLKNADLSVQSITFANYIDDCGQGTVTATVEYCLP